MRRFQVTVNGKVYEVEVEEIAGEEGVKIDEVASSKVASSKPEEPVAVRASQVPAGNEVKAPLGGSILSVKVNVGDTVRVGDLLVTLEAMKMENEITSPYDGEVVAVNVKEGTSVELGDVMVVIR